VHRIKRRQLERVRRHPATNWPATYNAQIVVPTPVGMQLLSNERQVDQLDEFLLQE
jgi:hypothetical protein